MAHPKFAIIRERFGYCCGYGGVSETEAAGELTVDHYWPSSLGGDESDENLIYACFRCNLHKSDYWPDAAAFAAGRRVLHPLQDDISLHLRENEHGVLEGLTETGRCHLEILHLNRSQLIAHRLRRKEIERQNEETRLLLLVLEIQAHAIASLEDSNL